jgi:NADPH2 dehydrogenase
LTGLSEFTINEIFKNFQQSTLIAANHGFNHIQIHAAHGYLLCIALDPVISPFCDTTAEQLIKWSDYTRQLGLETSIRLSWRSGLDRARDEERQSVLMQLFKSQFSFIDLSAGYYNINKHYIYPQTDEMLSARIQEGIDLANQHPHQDFICSGRVDINTLANWPQNLHAGVCRDLIANPNFLNDRIKLCNNHRTCHYYSRGKAHIDCGAWPTSPGNCVAH